MKSVFTRAAAEAAPPEAGRASSLALRRGEMELRYYAPKGVDEQVPHDQDEVYVVVSGSGVFWCEGRRERFHAGDAIFVAAGVEHRFEDFDDDFAVWVVFYGPRSGSKSG